MPLPLRESGHFGQVRSWAVALQGNVWRPANRGKECKELTSLGRYLFPIPVGKNQSSVLFPFPLSSSQVCLIAYLIYCLWFHVISFSPSPTYNYCFRKQFEEKNLLLFHVISHFCSLVHMCPFRKICFPFLSFPFVLFSVSHFFRLPAVSHYVYRKHVF